MIKPRKTPIQTQLITSVERVRQRRRRSLRLTPAFIAVLTVALLATLTGTVQAQEGPPDFEGAQYLILNERTGRLLDVDNASDVVADVDQSISARDDDRWTFIQVGAPSTYRITNVVSGGSLVERADGTVETDSGGETAGDLWSLGQRADGTFVITNTTSGRSLDADGEPSDYAVNTTLNIDDTNDDAHWRLLVIDPGVELLDDATVLLSNVATRRWLDVNRGPIQGANVDQSRISSTDDRWVLELLDNGNWLFQNEETGGWLSAASTSPYNTTTSAQRANADEWTLVANDMGEWSVLHADTGRALDADGRSRGYNVDTTSNTGQADARWLIAAATPIDGGVVQPPVDPPVDPPPIDQIGEVTVALAGPDSLGVGLTGPFVVTVTNNTDELISDTAANNLQIIVDGPLIETAVVDNIGLINPGATASFSVPVTAGDTAGSSPLQVVFQGTGGVLGAITVPLTIVDGLEGDVALTLLGPATVVAGAPADFGVIITNNTNRTLSEGALANLRLVLDGADIVGALIGTIPVIPPGQTGQVTGTVTFNAEGSANLDARLINTTTEEVLAQTTLAIVVDQASQVLARLTGVQCQFNGEALVVLRLTNNNPTDTVFVIDGDAFDPASFTLIPGEEREVTLNPPLPVGQYFVGVIVDGVPVLSTEFIIDCDLGAV